MGFQEMGTLRCDSCGEECFIGHHPASVDKRVAERQAKWLEKVLAEEHDQWKYHPYRDSHPQCPKARKNTGRKGNTMKIRFTLCFVLLSSLLMARDQTNDVATDASKLIALENAWNQAQLHHDAKALNNLVSDAFVYTDYDGTVMNKAQFLADLKDADYHASLIANEEARVISYPNVAIVIGTYHTKGTYKRQPFEHYGRFTDTWIYQNNKWQCVASHTNLLKK
jgi:ketosteroid isomerase-like protein